LYDSLYQLITDTLPSMEMGLYTTRVMNYKHDNIEEFAAMIWISIQDTAVGLLM